MVNPLFYSEKVTKQLREMHVFKNSDARHTKAKMLISIEFINDIVGTIHELSV